MNELSLRDVRLRIQEECDRLGSRQAYADLCGVSKAYLDMMFAGGRPPTPKLLKPLKITRRFVYEVAS